MTVSIPSITLYSTTNGIAVVTVSGTEYSQTVEHGTVDSENGKYPYAVTAFELEGIPSGTYDAIVSIPFGTFPVNGGPVHEVIGGCTVVVDAENQTPPIITWHDGAVSPNGPGL